LFFPDFARFFKSSSSTFPQKSLGNALGYVPGSRLAPSARALPCILAGAAPFAAGIALGLIR
jgi:hypothetical protein